jgi:hypothetical protein
MDELEARCHSAACHDLHLVYPEEGRGRAVGVPLPELEVIFISIALKKTRAAANVPDY